jgi:hypothetical protein
MRFPYGRELASMANLDPTAFRDRSIKRESGRRVKGDLECDKSLNGGDNLQAFRLRNASLG